MTPRIARPLVLLLASTVLAATVLLPATPAGAATGIRPFGRIGTTLQHRDGSVSVSGWAYDRNHPYRSITACLAVRGTCVRRVHADLSSRAFNRSHHIGGRHAFTANVRSQRRGFQLELRVYANDHQLLHSQRVLSPGERIVRLAKTYVGNTRYVDGGSTPQQGFDCSGYTGWVYTHSHVQTLPHNAQAQRFVVGMHRISRASARPGDLVFYFDGGAAFHVAIYAGYGKQYAAATPRDGITYQDIWSSNVEFRTDWH